MRNLASRNKSTPDLWNWLDIQKRKSVSKDRYRDAMNEVNDAEVRRAAERKERKLKQQEHEAKSSVRACVRGCEAEPKLVYLCSVQTCNQNQDPAVEEAGIEMTDRSSSSTADHPSEYSSSSDSDDSAEADDTEVDNLKLYSNMAFVTFKSAVVALSCAQTSVISDASDMTVGRSTGAMAVA